MTRLFTVGVALSVLLSGCAAESAPSAVPTPTPSESGSERPEPGSVPVPSFALECADVVDASVLSALYGTTIVERDPVPLTAADDPLIALIQDGALVCEWAPAGAPAFAHVLRVTLIENAPDAFAVITSTLAAAPLSYHVRDESSVVLAASCRDSAGGADCHWSAASSRVWIEASFQSLPLTDVIVPDPRENADTSIKPLEINFDSSTSSALVRTALTVAESAASVLQPLLPNRRACSEVAPATAPEIAALGAPVVDLPPTIGSTSAYSTIGQWALSLERQGVTRCTVTTGAGVRLALVSIPNAAWTDGTVSLVETCWIDGSTGCTLGTVEQGTLLIVSQDGSADPAVARSVLVAMTAAAPPVG